MPDDALEFAPSAALSMGVELEVQVLETVDYNLTQGASYLLEQIRRAKVAGDIKHEVTESMVELATGIHTRHDELLAELGALRDGLVAAADRLNLALCGGGAHPFQRWEERRIVDNPRYRRVSELYGYLAKQFTVFGQHVHIGCPGGDDALYLLHALSRYVPHFIALAASSPYYQGADTRFATSRLHVVSAFPLAGHCPWVTTWDEFRAYFERMHAVGIVASMKDFYWDIRPKPEYGTIELRVCDTPLTVRQAAAIAAYLQTLARRLLRERHTLGGPDRYLAYAVNRFNACRFGFDAELIDAFGGARRRVADDILATVEMLAEDATALGTGDALAELAAGVRAGMNGAGWMRERAAADDLSALVAAQAALWRGDGAPAGV